MNKKNIGLIAGQGQYPIQLAQRLQAEGHQVVVAGLIGLAAAADFSNCHFKHYRIGQIKAACAWFRMQDVTECVMAGGIRLQRGAAILLDMSLLPSIPALLFRGDDWRLRFVASVFGKRGVAVINPRPWILDWFAEGGHLGGPPLDEGARALLMRGISQCAQFVAKDVGQAVVVHGDNWIACEDRRGTDAAMGQAPGQRAILVKMKKTRQDTRFDIPSVGPETVHHASKLGFAAIAIQAGEVMLIEKRKMIQMCRNMNVSLVGFQHS